MKSRPIGTGQNILATQNNDRRDDARGGGFLLAHQQLGALSLGTNPTNGQTVTIDVNGTNIVATYVTAIGSTANNILIGASATASVTNLLNWLRRPDLTTSNQIAASTANQTLLSYVGWASPGSSTTIVPFSLNKNVNGITGGLTSFNITTTVTSGAWTAQTMQLYVEDGTYYIGNTRYLFTGGSTPTVTAPSSHPRIDVLTIDTSGTLAWTTGTEASSPVAPSYPNGKVPICELYNVVSETALYDNENQQSGEGYILNDVRPIMGDAYITSTSQIASGVVVFDPGSDARGDILYYNGSAWARLPAGTSGYVLQTQGASANPQWALASPTAIVNVTTQQSTTGNTGATYYTIYTSGTLPAITAGQSIWIRAAFSRATGYSTASFTCRVQANGTTIASVAESSSGSTGEWVLEAFLTCPTTSSQRGTITTGGPNVTTALSYTTSSANLASSFTFTFQANDATSGSQAQSYYLDYATIYVFN
jgi:hypothetical protein